MPTVVIDQAKCSGCGTCVDTCPSKVLEIADSASSIVAMVINEEECSGCGSCALKCPDQAIVVTGYEILKVEPPSEYPPEDGRYLRGNDYSPVAVVAILDTDDTKIPDELALLVTSAVEAGAALAGTLQTENFGIEKIVANIVANPNIRIMVLCWREAQGHKPAEAIQCLVENGVANDKRRTIIGASAPTPYLANLSLEAIERFRKQVKIVSLIKEEDPSFGMLAENVKRAVHACIQEKHTEFEDYILYDPGAWPESPICEKLSMRLTDPWRPEMSTHEIETLERMKQAAGKMTQPTQVSKILQRDEEDAETLLELLGVRRDSENREREKE